MLNLGYEAAVLATAKGEWTAREISQQPACLVATQAAVRADAPAVAALLALIASIPAARIVLTGAGSSAFIGEAVAPWLDSALPCRVEAVATTDLVSAPQLYLRRDAPTLLVSFARSGDSPESAAAVALASQLVRDVRHLAITCNPAGELAQAVRAAGGHVLVLPQATHDRGFAMTSSFSGMMLAALSALGGLDDENVKRIAAMVAATLEEHCETARALAAASVERVVFLGGGLFKGLAREAALKLLELTDGRRVAIHDTPLGFRHGPKTIVDPATLVVVFVSADPHARLYDLDLLAELRADGRARRVVGLFASSEPQLASGADIRIPAGPEVRDPELLFPYLAFAQMFAFHSSLALGLTPDNPNPGGLVNRVVRGVRIHRFGRS